MRYRPKIFTRPSLLGRRFPAGIRRVKHDTASGRRAQRGVGRALSERWCLVDYFTRRVCALSPSGPRLPRPGVSPFPTPVSRCHNQCFDTPAVPARPCRVPASLDWAGRPSRHPSIDGTTHPFRKLAPAGGPATFAAPECQCRVPNREDTRLLAAHPSCFDTPNRTPVPCCGPRRLPRTRPGVSGLPRSSGPLRGLRAPGSRP